MRMKIFTEESYPELERSVNAFLESIPDTETKINYEFLHELMIIVEYKEKPPKNAMCCECKFYDQTGDIRGAWGLCQMNGDRRRFTGRCDEYVDIRGK